MTDVPLNQQELAGDRKLRSVLFYICRTYPHARELSKARVTKMIYLADWRSAVLDGDQLTRILWTFNHYGPYVDDVVRLAKRDAAFEVLVSENYYGSPMELLRLSGVGDDDELSARDRAIVQTVIDDSAHLYWNDFIAMVYATYPVKVRPRYEVLELPLLATEYRVTQGGALALNTWQAAVQRRLAG